MKTQWTWCVLTGLTGMLLLSGCATRRVYVENPPVATAQITVTQPPPPVQREVIVTSPGPGYVWVPGYWSWHDRWVWVGGRWVVRPHPHARWHGGHWQRHGRTYVWVPGHWS